MWTDYGKALVEDIILSKLPAPDASRYVDLKPSDQELQALEKSAFWRMINPDHKKMYTRVRSKIDAMLDNKGPTSVIEFGVDDFGKDMAECFANYWANLS